MQVPFPGAPKNEVKRKAGSIGGKARARNLTPEQIRAIAQKGGITKGINSEERRRAALLQQKGTR